MKGLRLYLYTAFGDLMVFILGKERAKYFFEIQYWRMMWLLGRMKFPNEHYQAAYTEAFGLTVDSYANKKILDIGCGPRGSLEWTPESSICFGLDPLADQYLRLNGGRHRMTYVTANAESIPFDAGYFDFVSSFNSLDHVDDLDRVLLEIERILKTGGDFLLIADVHEKPALCEPIAIGWDLPDRLTNRFSLIFARRLKRDTKIFQSVRDRIPYDDGEYGLLVAHFKKK